MKKAALLSIFLLATLFGNAQTINLECNVYGSPADWEEMANTLYRINGSLEEGEYNACTTENAIIVAIIDPNADCEAWGTRYVTDSITHNPTNDFGNSNDNGGCRGRIEQHFVFRQNDPVQLDSLNELLTAKIPNAVHVLIYSWFNLDSAAIADGFPALVTTFNDLGWTSFDLSLGDVPFALYAEIGSPDFAQEVYGTDADDFIVLEQDFECDLIADIDSAGTSTAALTEHRNELQFAVNDNFILISGSGIENVEIQYICGLDGRKINYEVEYQINQIKIYPRLENNQFFIVNLINTDGIQTRKLISI